MREAVLLALVLVWLGPACATRVDVTVDESEDFARLRTWNWLPAGPAPEMGVDAPHRDPSQLQAHLGRLIEAQLRVQGFERAERADFFVIYHLLLAPRKVVVRVPRAPYLLSSMSHAPSYWIETNDEEIRLFEDFRLVIGLMTGSSRVLWRGVLQRKVDDGEDLSLDEAVTLLLERLPASQPDFEGDPRRERTVPPKDPPSHPVT